MNEEEYWRALRTALRNLYDHAALRRNPLASMFVPHAQGRGLQEILLEAVQELSPARGAAVQSDTRRTHQILQHRYVEQFSQGEVANSLGLSERQLRRQEQLAIRTLGESLRLRYDLPIIVATVSEHSDVQGETEEDFSEPGAEEHYQEEIERLHQETPLEALDVTAMIDGVVGTLQPLLQGLDLAIENQIATHLPGVNANAVALRQALMIALSAMARTTTGESIVIRAETDEETLHLTFSAPRATEGTTIAGGESLAMAQRLLAISGGELAVDKVNGELALQLTLPIARTLTILIIDDNQDSLQLCQRFLTGTLYQPVLARDPVEGLALAERIAPHLILLDVMMPGMDGWETLARLRRHPATETIPVVIFTILPEESLATALGAVGFLRKPFTREELLEAIQAATS